MNELNQVKPLTNRVMFKFIEDLDNSHFHGKSSGGIFVVEHDENQVKRERWGKVLAVGPDASDDVSVGEYILMEAMGWTNAMKMDMNDPDGEKFWFTEVPKILCVSDELPDEFQ